ncbi:hypothetical protein N4R57_07010 [Rhodobacteraceae bacterium D3-12]|nr:hypothetical protein N4R57_07010 [Rhodobacteraceae bacterium D3-12]
MRARWLICEGTWFVGVDALPNGADGALAGTALSGEAVRFAQSLFGRLPLHRGQASVVWPGYPKPRDAESDGAFRYRLKRDGAHVDGVKADSHGQRRLEEPHAWVLGIPLNEVEAGASPMVAWEGSHKIMQRGLLHALQGVEAARWGEVDVTEAYQAARREVFETCRRVTLPAVPGEAYVVHRLCLHGVAPWQSDVEAGADGRMVAYFRPEIPGGAEAWLKAD